MTPSTHKQHYKADVDAALDRWQDSSTLVSIQAASARAVVYAAYASTNVTAALRRIDRQERRAMRDARLLLQLEISDARRRADARR